MDMEGGGTWIGANAGGLSLCLLNLNPDPAPEPPNRPRSRGLIIPALLDAATTDAAVSRLSDLPLARFAPFRLIAVSPASDGHSIPPVAEARWDRTDLHLTWHAGPPVCFVSSGLGDGRVLPRLGLFEELVVRPGATGERQDRFHRHTWPDRPEVSVLMSRADARTVSITTLEVGAGDPAGPDAGSAQVVMGYEQVREPARASVVRAPALARSLRR
jgi:hypothetical protein